MLFLPVCVVAFSLVKLAVGQTVTVNGYEWDLAVYDMSCDSACAFHSLVCNADAMNALDDTTVYDVYLALGGTIAIQLQGSLLLPRPHIGWNNVCSYNSAGTSTCDATSSDSERFCACEIAPDPTASPTADPITHQTYTSKSGFGFSALTPSGEVVTWGKVSKDDYPGAGVTTTEARVVAPSGIDSIVASRSAFAAVKTGGTGLVAWGVEAAYAGADAYTTYSSGTITSLVANDAAFAGVDSTGKVFAFGAGANGGNISRSAFLTDLTGGGIQQIAASAGAFAARRDDGKVFSWGSQFAGAGVGTPTNSALTWITSLTASRTAFAAIKTGGGVVTFGDKYGGGDSSAVAGALVSGVIAVTAAPSAFIAYKSDSSVVVWGNSYYGADTTDVAAELTSGVETVAYTAAAFAALKAGGSVVTWGKHAYGGSTASMSVQPANVVQLASTKAAFAARQQDGSVVAWGDEAVGGGISALPAATQTKLASGVTTIASTHRAFAALRSTGEVVTWGSAYHGGDPGTTAAALLTSGVVSLCSNDVAFTAIKSDGTAVVWGHATSIPFSGPLTSSASLLNAECA
eukprot:CAMPEP_0174967040 /NCGR_PEP_ID=MMETSP0004_2-20121128/7367_1 /TAXON_ID=420556 /ORGANISM="Ochromonas sp., Strain CCMP1393" /LENGTH=573 /DNA_ID=CAMNT_0016216137 /DNA_START=64 /DNA_END=1789 /DNA_ORIENTATION=+